MQLRTETHPIPTPFPLPLSTQFIVDAVLPHARVQREEFRVSLVLEVREIVQEIFALFFPQLKVASEEHP